MRHETVEEFLERLSSRSPTPGGGASAALSAAQAAALLGMVARYTTGPRYAEHADTIAALIAESDALRDRSLELADADVAAFQAVADVYALPKGEERSARISAASVGAAEPPAAVVDVAERLTDLAGRLQTIGNRNVLADVAAGAVLAGAAAAIARVNIEVNLVSITDSDAAMRFHEVADRVGALRSRTDEIVAAAR